MVDYATAANVGSFLNITIDANSDPTKDEVEGFIEEHEDFIDQQTGHAFRTITITREYHNFPMEGWQGRYYYAWEGMAIHLKHREIRLTAAPNLKLDTAAGDKLEVFDGSTWIDWTATRTDARDGDFWVEPDRGILWIRTYANAPRKMSIRIIYRFGESAVPKDIRRATILLSAIDVTLAENTRVTFQDTGGSTSQSPYAERADRWRAQAMRIIKNREEILLGDI